jgi:hypothetical protein
VEDGSPHEYLFSTSHRQPVSGIQTVSKGTRRGRPGRSPRSRASSPGGLACAHRASASAATGSEGCTRSHRAGPLGSHQFHLPNSDTRAGTSMERTMVASSRIPNPSAEAKVFRSVPGPETSATKARNSISAALVTRRLFLPMPSMTAESVTSERSYSSRIREEDEYLVVHRQPEEEGEDHQGDREGHRPGRVSCRWPSPTDRSSASVCR